MRRAATAVGIPTSLRLVERDSKTSKSAARRILNLQTFDGYITVHGWDKQEVQLVVSKRAATEQQMRGISYRRIRTTRTINVIATFDKSFAQPEGNISSPNAVVNLELYVPRSSTVRLSSGDGRLELEGVNGKLELSTATGNRCARCAGQLIARTGDGRIQVENFDGKSKRARATVESFSTDVSQG